MKPLRIAFLSFLPIFISMQAYSEQEIGLGWESHLTSVLQESGSGSLFSLISGRIFYRYFITPEISASLEYELVSDSITLQMQGPSVVFSYRLLGNRPFNYALDESTFFRLDQWVELSGLLGFNVRQYNFQATDGIVGASDLQSTTGSLSSGFALGPVAGIQGVFPASTDGTLFWVAQGMLSLMLAPADLSAKVISFYLLGGVIKSI